MAGRPNRHTNPSKLHFKHKKNKGRFIFFKKKNREVKELLRTNT